MTNKARDTLLPREEFLVRVARSGLAAFAVVVASLAVGMAGYHWIEKMPWIDAFLNASMILAGMGPVGELHTRAANCSPASTPCTPALPC